MRPIHPAENATNRARYISASQLTVGLELENISTKLS